MIHLDGPTPPKLEFHSKEIIPFVGKQSYFELIKTTPRPGIHHLSHSGIQGTRGHAAPLSFWNVAIYNFVLWFIVMAAQRWTVVFVFSFGFVSFGVFNELEGVQLEVFRPQTALIGSARVTKLSHRHQRNPTQRGHEIARDSPSTSQNVFQAKTLLHPSKSTTQQTRLFVIHWYELHHFNYTGDIWRM